MFVLLTFGGGVTPHVRHAKSPVRKPLQARSRALLEVVLEATAQILEKDGYEGLTTNHVAERAGVSVGSIYQYFHSKDELVLALVDRHMDRLVALVGGELAAAVDLPLAEGARRVIGALVRSHMVDPDLHRAILEQVPKVNRMGRVREMDRQFEALLAALVVAKGREVAVDDPRMFAFLVVQTTKAVTLGALLDHPEYLQDELLADELTRMFMTYAAPLPTRARARARARKS
jgi:AcrR family transcriptional regulator